MLQTESAAEKWPFTPGVEAELRAAVRLPEGSPTLGAWEERGHTKGGRKQKRPVSGE